MRKTSRIKSSIHPFFILLFSFISTSVFSQVPVKVVITTQPVIGPGNGALMAVQPVVEIRDASDQKVTTSNAQVRISISSGTGGEIGGPTIINAVNGVGTFTDLTFTGVIGQSYQFQFSSDPVIAYEPFEYGAGTLTGNNGGSGWSAAWYGPSTAFPDLSVDTTGFSYTDFRSSGGRATYTSGTGGDGQRLLNAVSNSMHSTIWLAFLGNYTSQGGGFNNLRLYIDGTRSGAVGGNNGMANWSILDNTLSATTFSNVALDGTTHLALLKIDYTAGTSDLWIDPVVPTFDGTQTPSHTQNFAPVFDRIGLYNRNAGVGTDEITLASTFRAALHLDQNLTSDVSAAMILPVNWTYFSATCSGNSTLLKWGTTNEQNNRHFVVERKNEHSQWMVVGNVKGTGNNNTDNKYTFSDNASGEKLYYRLRQVDDNGKVTYSKIITSSCQVTGTKNYSVFPNPASNVIRLSGCIPGSPYRLINSSGKVVLSGQVDGEVGNIQVSNLPDGNYILQVIGYSSRTIQILKYQR